MVASLDLVLFSYTSSCFATCCPCTNSFTYPLTGIQELYFSSPFDQFSIIWKCHCWFSLLWSIQFPYLCIVLMKFMYILSYYGIEHWIWVREGKNMYSSCVEKLLSKEPKCHKVNPSESSESLEMTHHSCSNRTPNFWTSHFFTCKLTMKGWSLLTTFCVTLCCLTLLWRNTEMLINVRRNIVVTWFSWTGAESGKCLLCISQLKFVYPSSQFMWV